MGELVFKSVASMFDAVNACIRFYAQEL